VKIISGGQTGVDRAALDAALDANAACGGWCPKNRLAEDGRIADRYPLVELTDGSYRERTLQNVLDSDGTVVFYFSNLSGGTALTVVYCIENKKSFKLIDCTEISILRASELLSEFEKDFQINGLNVAGPRASGESRGYPYVYAVLSKFLIELARSN